MNSDVERSTDESALYDLFQCLVDAWNRGDGQRYGSLFTENADYIIWNGKHLTGCQAIADGHQIIFESIYKGSRLEGGIKSIRFLNPDIALLHVHGMPQMPGQTESIPEQYSIQTMIAIKKADGWRFTSFQNTLIQKDPLR